MTSEPQDQNTVTAEPDAEIHDLDELRAELDVLDERLLDTLNARIQCCVRIAQHKRRYEIPMMQPQRINVVQNRAARYATANDIDPTFLRRLYELVIDETCRVETRVIDGTSTEVLVPAPGPIPST